MWQTKAQKFESQVSLLKKANDSNPFVFVIIDGDGAVFQDALLKKGVDGGAEAGYLLWAEIKKYVTDAYPESASEDWSIIVQIVLNMDGLAKKLHASGIIPNSTVERTLADFGRGFGRSQPLFSFIDVGSGKESADHKIREMLRVMVRVTQCKHIFFGPCHDNGYLPVLEPYKLDPKVHPRLTLIETTPAEEGFKHLNFHRISFPSVFRTEKLPDRHTITNMAASLGIQPLPPPLGPKQQNGNGGGGALLRSDTNESQPPGIMSSPSSGGAQTPPSWSRLTKSTAPTKTIDISSTKKQAFRKYYLLNAESQRVDEPLPRTDIAAEKRFKERMQKAGNVCNAYHLHGNCKNGDECNYSHGEKLSPGELVVLKQKSRGIPCSQMSDCIDVTCMLGHHCRWLNSCEHTHCRFEGYHDIDPKPRLKVFEDGSTQSMAT
nr:C-x8-C-x5-C-x3-H type zinc finger protein [Colletotrichum truncatum]KAF6784087.1 C-x8-C-x5-C-x3-H type zinc finger protein [Colletotrichum truncatum]